MAYYNPYIQPTYFGTPAPVMPQQQSFAPMPQQPAPMSSNVIGVDGEIGAKAYMVPNGSTGPIALWDTNDNVIYLRTFNAAGMPNPLRKLRYTEEELTPQLPAGQSGSPAPVDSSMFATKDDLEALRQEIRNMRTNTEVPKVNPPAFNQNGRKN